MSSSDPQRDSAQPADQEAPGGRDAQGATASFRQQAASKQASPDDHDVEEELWHGGYSGKAMFGVWLLLIVVSIALLAASFFVAELTVPIALAVIVVMWLLGAAAYFWRRLGVDYSLTTQRFIHKAGLFSRRTDRIEVIDIDDVSYHQGLVQRLFGVGTIVISSTDRSHPELTMVGIDHVADVAGLIDDTRRKERRRRSLHIESI